MIELELTVMAQTPEKLAELQVALETFTSRTRIHVHLTPLNWGTAWSEIVSTAIHGHGPDVSEIGTSWVNDLVGMSALMGLSKQTFLGVGKQAEYLEQAWKSCIIPGDNTLWAIPWLSGARVLYFRRDWLEKAGLEPDTAFRSFSSMQDTLASLQANGCARPWSITTQTSLNTLHHIASWVWGYGGEFFSPDGRRLLFTEERALNGIAAYFSLGRYLGADPAELSDARAYDLFWSGQAGVTMDGLWILPERKASSPAEVIQNLGVGLVPGPSFVGGSNLVVWKNTVRPEAALELIRFLTSPDVLMMCYRTTGLLPAQRELTQSLEIETPEIRSIFNTALETGRSWPNLSFAALLENRLTGTLGSIWKNVLANPKSDIIGILHEHLDLLEKRLKISINP
jgi:multiple sugar transport system substrate-binding protein